MVGITVASPTNGARPSACPMPFCSAATRVAGPHIRCSHGPLDAVSWTLVQRRTQSSGCARDGSVSAEIGDSTMPSVSSTVICSMGRLTHATMSCRPAAASNPATTPPMLPSPMTAMRWRSELAVVGGMWSLAGFETAKRNGRSAAISTDVAAELDYDGAEYQARSVRAIWTRRYRTIQAEDAHAVQGFAGDGFG